MILAVNHLAGTERAHSEYKGTGLTRLFAVIGMAFKDLGFSVVYDDFAVLCHRLWANFAKVSVLRTLTPDELQYSSIWQVS